MRSRGATCDNAIYQQLAQGFPAIAEQRYMSDEYAVALARQCLADATDSICYQGIRLPRFAGMDTIVGRLCHRVLTAS